MICSGCFHPDNVMRQEQLFKANKKAYYMELQNYHDKYAVFLTVLFLTYIFLFALHSTFRSSMIGKLQLWKESLQSCNDSEEEMVERILRWFSFIILCSRFQVTSVTFAFKKMF